jgi:hypothetical protein
MDRRDLEGKVDLILSQAPGLPLGSRAYGLYTPGVQKPTQLSALLAGDVARPGDYELTGEHVTLLLVLNAQNPQLKIDLEDVLLNRLNDRNAHVITVTLIALGRLEALRLLLTESAPDFQIRLWTAVETYLSMQPHVFSETDLGLLTVLAEVAQEPLRPLMTPLGKVGAGMLVGVSGALITYGPDLAQAISGVTSRATLIRYRRLQKELLEGENPEINTDKRDLTIQMGRLGFRSAIADAFGEVDKKLSAAAGPFDFKGCMDLLRTAFEEMMEDAAKQIGNKRPRPLPQGSRLNHFAPWREYLEAENVLTKDQGGMTQQLYNYLSNAGSHQLGAGPKTARLSKNMVIELGLMVVEEVTRIS